MEQPTRNKKFVVTGGGIVILVALIVVVIWFIVTRANEDAALKAGTGSDSTVDTGNTNGVLPDSASK